jgi:pyruvate,water dikinase
VTRNTTPEWTPTFTIAAGLITDSGGPLSHASILAREFGIPAVMGVQTATRTISEGQLVTLDGGEGSVHLHGGNLHDR